MCVPFLGSMLNQQVENYRPSHHLRHVSMPLGSAPYPKISSIGIQHSTSFDAPAMM